MKEVINLKSIADLVEISDGYHTFTELYEHRITIFIALCRNIQGESHDNGTITKYKVFRSKMHSDGSVYDGWFILGIYPLPGKQITYHLPLSKWDETDFAETLEKAPEFDGHTPNDVLERLKIL